MSPILLYDRLAEVSEDLYRTIAYCVGIRETDKCALEALWVRLDDLVEQIPNALQDAAREAVTDGEEDEA